MSRFLDSFSRVAFPVRVAFERACVAFRCLKRNFSTLFVSPANSLGGGGEMVS